MRDVKLSTENYRFVVYAQVVIKTVNRELKDPFQTSNFTCAESNANEKNLLFSLICIDPLHNDDVKPPNLRF